MRRVLQLAVSLLILVPIFWPITELFDRWDAPGPDNDIEFAIFSALFILTLVLLIATVISRLVRMICTQVLDISPRTSRSRFAAARQLISIVIPHTSPPLRI